MLHMTSLKRSIILVQKNIVVFKKTRAIKITLNTIFESSLILLWILYSSYLFA